MTESGSRSLNPSTKKSALLEHIGLDVHPLCEFNTNKIKIIDACNGDLKLRFAESIPPKAQQANTKYTREINSSKDYLVIFYFALLLLNAYSILHLQCILAVNVFLVLLFCFLLISFLILYKITSNLNSNRVLK